MRYYRLLLCTAALVGCTDATDPGSPHPVDHVDIRLALSQTCVSGSCLPEPTGWTRYTATIVNTGSATAYLARCGDSPALMLQFFQHGTWVTFEPPSIACVNGPSPSIALASGNSLHLDVSLPQEPSRLVLYVGTLPDLSDAAMDASRGIMMIP